MGQLTDSLDRIITNLRKSGSRGYTKKTLILKLEEVEQIKKQFIEFSTGRGIQKESIEKFYRYYEKAKTLLEQELEKLETDSTHSMSVAEKEIKNSEKLETDSTNSMLDTEKEIESSALTPENSNSNSTVKMASFNLELSLKSIPEFSGNFKDLTSFLKIVEIIYNSLTTEAKILLIDFVINVKLTPGVRTAISTNETNDFNSLKNSLQSRYKSTKTIAQIQLTLSKFMQRNMKIQKYNEKLLEMIAELNELQINEIPQCNTTQKNTIISLNNTYALNIFKNGLNVDIKPTIFASKPKDLNEAVQLAIELEKDFASNENQVLYFSNRNNSNRRNNYNNNKSNNSNHNNNNRNDNSNKNINNGNNNNNRNNKNYHNNHPNNGKKRFNNRNNNNNNGRRNQNNNNNYNNRNDYNRKYVHIIQENSEDPEMDNQNLIIHPPEQN